MAQDDFVELQTQARLVLRVRRAEVATTGQTTATAFAVLTGTSAGNGRSLPI